MHLIAFCVVVIAIAHLPEAARVLWWILVELAKIAWYLLLTVCCIGTFVWVF